jgi:2-dehydropantoate 2-reductase
MRALVIGAGAVGGFLGARLGLAGHDVVLVGRSLFVEAVNKSGLLLAEPDGTQRTVQVLAFDNLAAALTSGAPYDLALLTVKAYDTANVAAELKGSTAAPPPVLTLQNGVGNEEVLTAVFGPDKVVAAAIETPVSLPFPGRVQIHRSRFRVGLASVGRDAPLSTALELLRAAGLDASVYCDYRRLKWSKLLLNLPGNALCAILDWSPARVMAHPLASQLEARAWQEAFRVMSALGVRPVTLAGYPLPLIGLLAHRLPPPLLALGLARTVSGGRGTKPPSLHMALSAGQQSEVGWLNGAVARAAQQFGIPAPVNRVLTEVLTALTENRAAWDDWRGCPERVLAGVGE